MNKKYISVAYDGDTQSKLREWCKKNGFDLTNSYGGKDIPEKDFDFHTTIFYSNNPSNLVNQEIYTGKLVSYITGFKLLGLEKDVPVLTVDSPDLRSIRRYYRSLGLTDNWPDWIPHVSLSYVKKEYDLSDVPLPDFDLYFEKLVVDDVADEV